MMKWLLILLVILATLPLLANAQELDLCDDFIPLRNNCTFVTPTIDACTTFDYDIFHKNGSPVVTNAPLSSFNNSIYQFNFTLTNEAANYVIQLCDGTTREVFVQAGGREGNTMSFIAVGVIMMGVIGILTWVSFSLTTAVTTRGQEDGKWTPLRIFFLAIAMILVIGMINVSRIIAQDSSMNAGIVSILEIFYVVSIVGLMGIGFIAFVYYLVTVINYFKNQKVGNGSGRFDR